MTRTPLLLCLALLLIPFAPSAVRADGDAAPKELTRENLPTLLSKAAGTAPQAVDILIQLGPKLHLRDITSDGIDTSLTLAVLFYFDKPNLQKTDFALEGDAHRKDLAGAMMPTRVEAGKRVRLYSYASVLFPEYVTAQDWSVDGDTASGSVSFRAPGAYAGRVGFLAQRGPDGWAITELKLAESGIRVRRVDGRWRLDRSALSASLSPLRGKSVRLPRVTLARRTPAQGRVVISLTRDAELRVPGRAKPLGLKDLVAYLADMTRDPSMREVDGTSRLHAILDIDESMPWAPATWLMMACADPRVRIYKVAFGVQAVRHGIRGHPPRHAAQGPRTGPHFAHACRVREDPGDARAGPGRRQHALGCTLRGADADPRRAPQGCEIRVQGTAAARGQHVVRIRRACR